MLRRGVLAVLWILTLVALASLSPSSVALAQTGGAADDVWAVLKRPGHVLLMRHSNAPGSVPESNDMDFKDCSIQRNLDQDGRAQAARVGDAFRKHNIRQLRLFSSRYCRALDTAKLMKLGPVNPLPILNQVTLLDVAGMKEAGIKGKEFIKKIPAGQPTMLISHVTNIQAMADVKLDSGEIAVVHVDRSGAIVVDGKIAVP